MSSITMASMVGFWLSTPPGTKKFDAYISRES